MSENSISEVKSVIVASGETRPSADHESGDQPQDRLTDQARKYIEAYPPNADKVKRIVSWLSNHHGIGKDREVVNNQGVQAAVNHALGLAEVQALQGYIGFSEGECAEDYLAAARQLAHEIGQTVPLDTQLGVIETGELARLWKGLGDEIPDESQPLTDDFSRSLIDRVRSTLQRVGEIEHLRHGIRNRERAVTK